MCRILLCAESCVEVWLIGCEGLTGIPALLGVNTTFHQYAGLTEGRALRINAAELRDATHQSHTLSGTLLRFVQVILVHEHGRTLFAIPFAEVA